MLVDKIWMITQPWAAPPANAPGGMQITMAGVGH